MSGILIGQSYFLRFDPKLWQAMQPYAPLGSLYAVSHLRRQGHEVHFFDAMLAGSEADWREALDRTEPEIAVLFEDNFNYLSKMCLLRMRQAALVMCRMAKERGCTVVHCGSDATDHPEVYFQAGADFVIAGEGEMALAELAAMLGDKTRPARSAEIASLVWREADGSLRRNTRRPPLQHLDDLPFPAWDCIDVPRYRQAWRHRHGYFSMNMVTTRGCPYHCNWCAKPIWGQRYNTRSPQNVLEELAWIIERHQPDHIAFADDILGLKPGWIQEFARLVENHGIRIPFKSLNRADLLLRGDTIAALKRAGCRTCWLGAESGSQKILDAMEKGTTVAQIERAAGKLHEAGIEVGFFIQFGYPGETWEDIEKTMRMIKRCRPDDIGISISYPLPGTKFYDQVKAQLGEKQNWQDSDDLAMLYQGQFTTAFYRQLHRVVHREFRRRRALDAVARGIRSPRQFSPFAREMVRIAAHSCTLPFERIKLGNLRERSFLQE